MLKHSSVGVGGDKPLPGAKSHQPERDLDRPIGLLDTGYHVEMNREGRGGAGREVSSPG